MWRLAAPVYVELLTAVVAVSVIDTLWVSGLGPEAVAAVSMAGATEYFAYGVMMAVSLGVTVLTARGRTDLQRTGLAMWGVVSVLIAVPGFLLRDQIAGFFSTPAAAGFFAISLPCLPIYFAQVLVDGVFKGNADTRTPMRTAILCNALVILLDPLLIYAADLGIQGAALATALARALTLSASAWLLFKHGLVRPEARVRLSTAWAILRTGLPISLDFLSRSAVGMLLGGLVGTFGVAALAGYGIGLRIMLAGVMLFYALRQAATILAARGGEPLERRALKLGLIAGVVVAGVLAAAAEPLVGLFTDDPAEGVRFLRYMAAYVIPFGGLIALGGVLQARGKGTRVLVASLSGFAVQLPLSYGLSGWIGVAGAWIGMAAGAVTTLLALLPAVPRPSGDRAAQATRTAEAQPSAL